MTAPIRDVIASLDTRLDDLRQARTWQAISRTLDAGPAAATGTSPTFVASPIAAGAAVVGAAVLGALAMWLALRTDPAATDIAIVAPSIDVASEPAELATFREQTTAPVGVDVPEPPPAPEKRRRPAPPAPRGAAANTVAPTDVTADELYRRAEAALAAHDRASAREILHDLLVAFPTSPLVDAARYDLALIAVADRDEVTALRQLDELIVSSRDPNILAAARRLRRVVARE